MGSVAVVVVIVVYTINSNSISIRNKVSLYCNEKLVLFNKTQTTSLKHTWNGSLGLLNRFETFVAARR